MVRLGNICKFQSGGTPNKSKPEYFNGNIPWITTVALNGGTINQSSAISWITELAIQESAAKIVPAHSIMVGTRVGIGKVAINSVPMSTSQDVISLVDIDDTKWDKHFICELILSKNQFLISQARGATIKGIKIETLSNIQIPDISLQAQRHIAAVLDKVSDLIAKRKQQLDKLDEIVKAKFVEMFGDTILNPNHLQSIPLQNMADIVSGITKGRKTNNTELFEVPYMAVSNVKAGHIDWTTIKTIEATKAEIEQYRLLPYDVLMTEGGDPDKLGRGAIIREPPENCIHQNHIFRVRTDMTKLLPQYFEEYLQHAKAKKYFLNCAKQTTGIASINMKQLRNLPVLLPDLKQQREFSAFVEQIDCQKLTIQRSCDKLEVLKKALMQNYFKQS